MEEKENMIIDDIFVDLPEEEYQKFILEQQELEKLTNRHNQEIVEHIIHTYKEGREAFGEKFFGVFFPYHINTELYEWQPYNYLEIKRILKEHHISILKDTKRKLFCTFPDTDKYTIAKLRKLDRSYRSKKKKAAKKQ